MTPLPVGACLRRCRCRYDHDRCEVRHVRDMQLLAAMAPPGGGRNAFSQRISACFSTINMTQPSDAALRRIFGTLLATRLADFDDDVRPLAEPIAAASVDLYRAISRELLPTPSKSHYLFSTRDLGKIVLGVMQVCLCAFIACLGAHGVSSGCSAPMLLSGLRVLISARKSPPLSYCCVADRF